MDIKKEGGKKGGNKVWQLGILVLALACGVGLLSCRSSVKVLPLPKQTLSLQTPSLKSLDPHKAQPHSSTQEGAKEGGKGGAKEGARGGANESADPSNLVSPELDPSFDELSFDLQKNASEHAQLLKSLKKVSHSAYTVTSGDEFELFVYEETELNMDSVRVRLDGRISLKLVGEINVLGDTLAEATEKIRQKLSKYLVDPKPLLLPKNLRGDSVMVRGAVKTPQKIALVGNMNIAQVIAKAGGVIDDVLSPRSVDYSKSYLRRGDAILPIDFSALLVEGDPSFDIPLKRGDLVYLGYKRKGGVYTLGEIPKPGFYPIEEGLTLLQLLSRAGGIKPSGAGQMILIRGGLGNPTAYSLRVKDFLTAKHADVLLKEGDILYLPLSFLDQWNNVVKKILPSIDAVDKSIGVIDTLKGW